MESRTAGGLAGAVGLVRSPSHALSARAASVAAPRVVSEFDICTQRLKPEASPEPAVVAIATSRTLAAGRMTSHDGSSATHTQSGGGGHDVRDSATRRRRILERPDVRLVDHLVHPPHVGKILVPPLQPREHAGDKVA